jgi:hypothetical protein
MACISTRYYAEQNQEERDAGTPKIQKSSLPLNGDHFRSSVAWNCRRVFFQKERANHASGVKEHSRRVALC